MAKKLNIQTCQFVVLTDVIPPPLMENVSTQISENGNLTWGSNNRSLITAESIAREIDDEAGNTPKECRQLKALVTKLLKLDQMYIDLEN
jgi:hypothetical protein